MKTFFKSILILTVLIVASDVSANSVSIRPFLIDQTVEPRGITTEDIVLTNQTNSKQNLYATVNEISIGADGTVKEFVAPIMSDRTNSITSWIEITRGRIELDPGETKTIPVTFRIHPQPVPGEYHAFLGFVPASKRYQAENTALAGEADGVIVKLTIAEETNESLRISGFVINRFVLRDSQREVDITVENLGDMPTAPNGELIFYDSTGQEVVAVPVNSDNVVIPPGESVTIKSTIPFSDELGRYKANVSLQYGKNQQASLYDTTQFYMMPLEIILLILVLLIGGALSITWLLHRALSKHDDESDGAEVALYVRDGHEPNPKDHDIDLSKK